MSEVKVKEVYPLIEKALIQVAQVGGYEALYLPTDTNTLSNRTEIAKEAQRRYKDKIINLPAEISWNHVPAPYPFGEVYEIWKRVVPALAPIALDEALGEQELLGAHL